MADDASPLHDGGVRGEGEPFVQIVMPAAQATAKLLAGRPLAESFAWLRILLAFDLVFAYACMLVFPATLDD
ncbi:MAG: hypothetical protein ACKOFO_08035 [Gemmatimonadota bacterium]